MNPDLSLAPISYFYWQSWAQVVEWVDCSGVFCGVVRRTWIERSHCLT